MHAIGKTATSQPVSVYPDAGMLWTGVSTEHAGSYSSTGLSKQIEPLVTASCSHCIVLHATGHLESIDQGLAGIHVLAVVVVHHVKVSRRDCARV